MLGPRVAALVLALGGAALIGCNDKPTAGATLDSPDAAGAGAEARAQRARADRTALAGGVTPARSLVAVATTSANEAAPCERTCGRIGDCLLGGEEVNAFEAGRLELACLELCVHTPESQIRTAFLDCETQSTCGELLGCARRSWEPLSATHQGPTIQGVAARPSDPCVDGCQWYFYCAYANAPPGEGYLAPEYEGQLRVCEAHCESAGFEREFWGTFAACAPSNCSSMTIGNCF